MARIEQSAEEKKLYNDLRKLAKQANQRLLRLERLTGKQETFVSKELYDYLSVSNIQAISKTGRIRVSKKFNLMQLSAIIKVTQRFLEEETSRVAGVKKVTKEYSEKLGKKISFKQASTLFQTGRNYTWIYEFIPKSEFWDNVKVSKQQGWDKEEFIDQIKSLNERLNDRTLKKDLESLYLYVMSE